MSKTKDKPPDPRSLDALADRMIMRLNGSIDPKPHKFLGMDLGKWMKIVVATVIAAIVFLFTWYNSVNEGLRARPTKAAVTNQIDNLVAPIYQEVKSLSDEQQKIRESVIKQQATDEAQTQVLKDIKDDIKHLRRRKPQ